MQPKIPGITLRIRESPLSAPKFPAGKGEGKTFLRFSPFSDRLKKNKKEDIPCFPKL